MRRDMCKVLTERERVGSSNKSLKTALKISPNLYDPEKDYSYPSRVSFSRYRHHYFSKEFSDNDNPLRRYLYKQVGRPWDVVYSEICEVADYRSLTGYHLLQHVGFEVELYCWVRDGEVYDHPDLPHRPRGLYVHPVSGLLCSRK